MGLGLGFWVFGFWDPECPEGGYNYPTVTALAHSILFRKGGFLYFPFAFPLASSRALILSMRGWAPRPIQHGLRDQSSATRDERALAHMLSHALPCSRIHINIPFLGIVDERNAPEPQRFSFLE